MRHIEDQTATGRTGLTGRALLAAIVILTACGSTFGGETVRVVLVPSSDAAPYMQTKDALEKRLTQQGVSVTSEMLASLREKGAIASDVDVFIGIGTQAAGWLHGKVKSPSLLVYCMVASPAAIGLTTNDGASGVSTDVPLDAQFKLIADALPEVKSVGMLYRSDSRGASFIATVEGAMPKGWKLEAVAVDRHNSVADAIEELLSRKVDVIWTMADSSVYDVPTVRSLLLSAVRRNKPVFGFSPAFVRAGALLGIGIDPITQAQQAAELTQELIKKRSRGENVAGVSRDPNYQIAVNLIVAKKLSIDFPEGFVDRAVHVFKPKEN